jgi:GNAT superfamily N-acetyltransferase
MVLSRLMPLDISPARGRADLKAFIDLPYRLHAGTPWIPPLKLERHAFLTRPLNPFFKSGDAGLFLARRDGRVVGRISAQYHRNFNEFHDNRWGFYGMLEFENDQEVLDGLLDAAAQWLKAQGRDRMIGPFDLTINEECGILIEGFELEPMIHQPWHPPYYRERIEAAGLVKAMDVFHWNLRLDDRDTRMLEALPRIAQRSHERHGISIRKMSFWKLEQDLREFQKIYNAAWSKNWSFQPLDKHDIADMAMLYRLVFDKRWFMLAENDKEVVAAAITIPDINQVLKRMKGRLLPLGWWHYLNRKRIITRCRVGFLGVLPEYQHTGVAAQLYMENFDMAAASQIKWGEPGWILETNHSMNRGLEAMGGRVCKRMRIYERLLEDGAAPAAPPADVQRYVPSDPA